MGRESGLSFRFGSNFGRLRAGKLSLAFQFSDSCDRFEKRVSRVVSLFFGCSAFPDWSSAFPHTFSRRPPLLVTVDAHLDQLIPLAIGLFGFRPHNLSVGSLVHAP